MAWSFRQSLRSLIGAPVTPVEQYPPIGADGAAGASTLGWIPLAFVGAIIVAALVFF